MGKYIDKSEPKSPMFSYAIICVEFDLEKGLPEAINLSIDDWSHLQIVDYEKIPFKCKYCHEYGHFTKSFPKKPEKSNAEENPEEGWNVASRKKSAKAALVHPHPTMAKNTTENKFQVLANEDM